jgi:hypothetical protein
MSPIDVIVFRIKSFAGKVKSCLVRFFRWVRAKFRELFPKK